jgi:hypothetical protein
MGSIYGRIIWNGQDWVMEIQRFLSRGDLIVSQVNGGVLLVLNCSTMRHSSDGWTIPDTHLRSRAVRENSSMETRSLIVGLQKIAYVTPYDLTTEDVCILTLGSRVASRRRMRTTMNHFSARENPGIFVVRDGVLYTHLKKVEQPPRFHHSSFFAGDVVEAAGILVCDRGDNLVLYPHSGHYRPMDRHFLNFLLLLRRHNVCLDRVTVDVQRTLRTARLILPGNSACMISLANSFLPPPPPPPPHHLLCYVCILGGDKVKKKETAWMWSAVTLHDFLTTKVGAWDRGLFRELTQRVVNRQYLLKTRASSRVSCLDPCEPLQIWDAALLAVDAALLQAKVDEPDEALLGVGQVAISEGIPRSSLSRGSDLNEFLQDDLHMEHIDEEALANKVSYPSYYSLDLLPQDLASDHPSNKMSACLPVEIGDHGCAGGCSLL